MKCRKLTNSGDYSFGAGDKDYISGAESIAQAIKTKILLFYNEWWEDLGIGIPLFQSFVGQTNPETIKVSFSNIVEQRIKDIQGIKSVKNTDVEINRNTRTMKLIIDVITSENELVSVEVSL